MSYVRHWAESRYSWSPTGAAAERGRTEIERTRITVRVRTRWCAILACSFLSEFAGYAYDEVTRWCVCRPTEKIVSTPVVCVCVYCTSPRRLEDFPARMSWETSEFWLFYSNFEVPIHNLFRKPVRCVDCFSKYVSHDWLRAFLSRPTWVTSCRRHSTGAWIRKKGVILFPSREWCPCVYVDDWTRWCSALEITNTCFWCTLFFVFISQQVYLMPGCFFFFFFNSAHVCYYFDKRIFWVAYI